MNPESHASSEVCSESKRFKMTEAGDVEMAPTLGDRPADITMADVSTCTDHGESFIDGSGKHTSSSRPLVICLSDDDSGGA